MRTFLFVLLTAVAAVLLWAIWSQSYVDSLVFTLGLIATGLCGYLISDYFFTNEKKTWQSDIAMYKKEISALKEELDISHKQLSMTIPQAEVDDLRKRLRSTEDERNRLNSEFLAQVGNISSLNTRLENIQKEYSKYQEESSVTSESRLTELEALRDTLSNFKNKLTELAQQNKNLKEEIAQLIEAAQSTNIEIVVDNRDIEKATANHTNTVGGMNKGVDVPIVFLNNSDTNLNFSTHRSHSRSVEDENGESYIHAQFENENENENDNDNDNENENDNDNDNDNDAQLVENQPIAMNSTEHGAPENTEYEPAPSSSSYSIDGVPEDLKVVEGIGPKIEVLLKESGIKGLKDLSIVPIENLKEILAKGGARYRLNDPSSWPEQARLLVNGEVDKLKTYASDLLSKNDK